MNQERNIVLSIVLLFVTFGIYGLYWIIKMTDEVNALSGETKVSGGKALLLMIVTLGIYSFFWSYNMGKGVYVAQERAGVQPNDKSILYVVLAAFQLSIVSFIMIQSDINALVSRTRLA